MDEFVEIKEYFIPINQTDLSIKSEAVSFRLRTVRLGKRQALPLLILADKYNGFVIFFDLIDLSRIHYEC